MTGRPFCPKPKTSPPANRSRRATPQAPSSIAVGSAIPIDGRSLLRSPISEVAAISFPSRRSPSSKRIPNANPTFVPSSARSSRTHTKLSERCAEPHSRPVPPLAWAEMNRVPVARAKSPNGAASVEVRAREKLGRVSARAALSVRLHHQGLATRRSRPRMRTRMHISLSQPSNNKSSAIHGAMSSACATPSEPLLAPPTGLVPPVPFMPNIVVVSAPYAGFAPPL